MPELTRKKVANEKQTMNQGQKHSLRKASKFTDDDDSDDEMVSLPDYLTPVRKTMSGNFRSLHEEHLVNRLMTKWNTVKDDTKAAREQAMRMVRRIAVEELTKDWLLSEIDIEVCAFLVDKILPTLVLGVEKLLVEVDKRHLVETEVPDDNFNPLNFLAQYLMRNNPKYNNFAEASPYMRGLRSVSEELKLQLLSLTDNRLLQIKMSTHAKRREREVAESLSVVETQRRIDALHQQFMEWGDGKKIDLALVQNALLSFMEVVSRMAPEVKADVQLGRELDPTDDTGKGVHQTDFVEHLMPFVMSMSNTAFDLLLSHLCSCAKVYRYYLESLEYKASLTLLFKSCDYNKSGLLSRLRILQLLTAFYKRLPQETQNTLRDPRQWPVQELSELDAEEADEEVNDSVTVSGLPSTAIMKSSPGLAMNKSVTEPISKEEEIQLQEMSLAMVEKAVNDAKLMITIAEGRDFENSSDVSSTTQENDQGSLLKAVSAGSKMINRGVAFVDRTKLDNWTGTLTYGSFSQSQLCVFNEYTLDVGQFVQLIDTFLNMSSDSALFEQLLSYIKEGYVMAEDENTLRIMQERLTAEEAQHKAKLNRLFDIWDNEGSGYLNCDEVAWILGTYKDLKDNNIVEKALTAFQEKFHFHDDKFTKHEFREFILSVVKLLPRSDTFDMFVEFLIGSIALSYAEQARGDARKKWLQHVIVVAETSGSNMESVYKFLFDALKMDAEMHGDGKIVSISIALLERNVTEPDRGPYVLHYTAATPDHARNVMGQVLYRDMKGISFAALESGRPIHVPSIRNHGNIHFWDKERNSENTDGSFIVIPFKDKKKRAFGLLCIDTINDPRNQKTPEQIEAEQREEEFDSEEMTEDGSLRRNSMCMFSNHEIQFHQGVAKAFSIAYHLVNVRQKMMQVSEHALEWIVHRCPNIKESTFYLTESTCETMDVVLRKMMSAESGQGVIVSRFDPPRLERKDNFFREYLFRCVDSSELVPMTAYGELHLAIPLRNNEGHTVIVYDVNLGNLTVLPKTEMYEMTRALRLLQAAYREISIESQDGIRVTVLKGDQLDNDTRTEILFGRLMLLKLRQSISKLDGRAYAELRNDFESRAVILTIIKAVLCILQPDLAKEDRCEDLQNTQLHVGPSIGAQIVAYDPTEHSLHDTPVAEIESWLKHTTYEQIGKHKSHLLRHFYNWASISLLLITLVSQAKETKGRLRAD